MNAHSKVETGKVTSKGQILIPKAVRDAIGLKPNAPYKITVNAENQAVISPIGYGPDDAEARVRRMQAGLKLLTGRSADGRGTDKIMRELRGDWQP